MAESHAQAARALGAHLPPLLVAAERVAATVAQGVHGRRRVGQGDSFWQYRPLLPGEGAQRIDWRQSARAASGRHFVRETEWEAAQTVLLWRAGGASADWRSDRALPSKRERAELLLLALAALLLRGGERVALLGAASRPVGGRGALERLAATLAGDTGSGDAPLPSATPRHATAVLLGDWLGPLEASRAALSALAARQVRGHVLQVLDPAEADLPYAGRIRFASPDPNAQGGVASALIGRAEGVRDAYTERLAAQQAGMAAICRAAGFGFGLHRTDQPPQAALLALYSALSPARVRG